MKERPILMSAPVVRSTLRAVNPKTQTRRVCKNKVYGNGFKFDGNDYLCHNDYLPPSALLMDYRAGGFDCTTSDLEGWGEACPYGLPGDRLWVRETWGVGSRPDPWGGYDGIEYRADEAWLEEGDLLHCHKVQTPDDVCLGDYRSGWKPSIHMPRWACRLVLEVTGVRVERLQDISEADAKAEGVQPNDGYSGPEGDRCKGWRDGYRQLWEQINGPGTWDANPWVWAVAFRRMP